VAAADPKLPLVSFKFMQGVSHGELMAEAQHRLQRHALVVANRAEEITPERQVAWIVSASEQTRVEGKEEIAVALADRLEGWWPDSPGPDQAATGTW
jgi:phosphopantothenoylcysteine decarboxylase/phosphopantothenate--cysteine ligase